MLASSRQLSLNTSDSASPRWRSLSLLPPSCPLPLNVLSRPHPYTCCHPGTIHCVMSDQGVCVYISVQDCRVYANCPAQVTEKSPLMLRVVLYWTINYMIILFLFTSECCSVHHQFPPRFPSFLPLFLSHGWLRILCHP